MKAPLFALLLIFFVSCSEDEQPVNDQPLDCVSQNDQDIQEYLAENNLEAEKSSSGLYYVIEEEGTGEQPTATDDVRVASKGTFINGEVFDDSPAEGLHSIYKT